MDDWTKKQELKISLLEKKSKLEKARKKIASKLENIDREICDLNNSICQIEGHTFKELNPYLTKMGICTTKKCEVCGKVVKEFNTKNEGNKKVLKK